MSSYILKKLHNLGGGYKNPDTIRLSCSFMRVKATVLLSGKKIAVKCFHS